MWMGLGESQSMVAQAAQVKWELGAISLSVHYTLMVSLSLFQ